MALVDGPSACLRGRCLVRRGTGIVNAIVCIMSAAQRERCCRIASTEHERPMIEGIKRA